MESSRKEVQAGKKEEETVIRSQGIGIRCPKCQGKSRVRNSVSKPAKSIQGRYRECDNCHHRFYTEEKFIRNVAQRN